MENMTISEVVAEISENYSKLKSLTVVEGEDCVNLYGCRYRNSLNSATFAQIDYIVGLPNVTYQSKSNLRKTNKWFASAVIDIAKKYENINFNIQI